MAFGHGILKVGFIELYNLHVNYNLSIIITDQILDSLIPFMIICLKQAFMLY